MKLTMIRSLIVFALFSNTAFASQSAVDYLSTQGISMFDFGMFRLSNSHNNRIDILEADFNINAMGAAYFDDGKERLVLSTMIFDLGDFKSGKEACWSVISEIRDYYGVREGVPLLGEGNSALATQFKFDGGGRGQTARGMEMLVSLEKNTIV